MRTAPRLVLTALLAAVGTFVLPLLAVQAADELRTAILHYTFSWPMILLLALCLLLFGALLAVQAKFIGTGRDHWITSLTAILVSVASTWASWNFAVVAGNFIFPYVLIASLAYLGFCLATALLNTLAHAKTTAPALAKP